MKEVFIWTKIINKEQRDFLKGGILHCIVSLYMHNCYSSNYFLQKSNDLKETSKIENIEDKETINSEEEK